MPELLVTGGTGTLGRQVVTKAAAAGIGVRGLSRSHRADDAARWHVGDLLTSAGLTSALDGVDVVVHCATQATGGKDVTATENLLAATRQAGVGHVVYVSIVGVDRIPLPYYKTKVAVEELLASSGVGHTILRATQFHDLVVSMFAAQRFSPVLFALRGTSFQPIGTGDVADALVALAEQVPAGRVPDLGGPEVITHTDLAQAFRAARGIRRPVAAVPAPGRIAAAYRAGHQLARENPAGQLTFASHLAAEF